MECLIQLQQILNHLTQSRWNCFVQMKTQGVKNSGVEALGIEMSVSCRYGYRTNL